MAKTLGDWFIQTLAGKRPDHKLNVDGVKQLNPLYEGVAPWALGSNDSDKNIRRHRKDIYSKWELMLKDPTVSEAMGIHVAAALGGHEARSDMVFVTPKNEFRNKRYNDIQKKINIQKKALEPIINSNIIKICRDAISFGDAYTRIYAKKGVGVLNILCNEYTYPPLIQAYEQAGLTVGYHVLEQRNWQRLLTALNRVQMLRMKIPRMAHVPQMDIVEAVNTQKLLQSDTIADAPILPSHIGGSFLYEIEEPWWNVQLALATMNSQQIADSVNQVFLTLNMQGMPPAQQAEYRKGLETIVTNHTNHIKEALNGGDAIWGTQYHVLPTWDEKQILNPLGDIKGQRSSPINIEVFMINVRRLIGGLGLDISMVGWADLLSGGLGNGGFVSTSIQTMRRSMMIRQAATDYLNQLLNLDWGYRFGEMFEENQYPWQIEFYSDQTAAATEASQNKQNRMNTLSLVGQSLSAIKEVGLDAKTTAMLLESVGGFDLEQAQAIAKSLSGAGGQPSEDDTQDDQPNDSTNTNDADADEDF